MPVKKTAKTKKKKENKEPSKTPNGNDSSSMNDNSSLKGTKKAQSSASTTSSRTQKPSSSSSSQSQPQHKHIRSIKELSSLLNTSSSHSSNMTIQSPNRCFSNRKITDYFQIRKSSRKCKSDLDKERKQFVHEAIKQGREEGLEVRCLENKGRAIFAARDFAKGEFVCEYAGEMISYQAAKKREEMYAQDETIGCYMYFFEYKSKAHCIDATSETTRLGRLLNHSKLDGNCQAKLFETEQRPHIILVAARDIKQGEEMTYDYGDRNKVSIAAHPWLAT